MSRIPIAKPWTGDEEAEAARRPLSSGWVVQGPEVLAFESEFAAFVGTPHAAAVSSGTTALFLALAAVGVEAGDEVITVSHSFIATANVVRHLGAKPVFVDVDPISFNIDVSRVEAAVGPQTRAILAVHQLGMPCDLAGLAGIADRHGLALVEDAACAIGSERQVEGTWERIGAPHSAAACFSFHPRKMLTTGDGGMVTTRDPSIDAFVRAGRNHGIERGPDGISHTMVGWNCRLTDIQAAIGRAQLAKLPAMLTRRHEQARRYDEAFEQVDALVRQRQATDVRSNWQSYALVLPDGVDQAEVRARLNAAGVSSLGGVLCAHRQPAYQGYHYCPSHAPCPELSGPCQALPSSEAAQDRVVMLPIFHTMTVAEQDQVIRSVIAAITA